jgi:hypothetical protein
MTMTLPDAWLIDAHLDMGSKHEKLHKLAFDCGGAVTKKFSQGSDDRTKGVGYWYHQRKKASGKRWGGVCKALSIYWIAYHANDKDFWGWLFKEGWAQAENAERVCDLHGAYSNRGNVSQDTWAAKVLASVGVIPQRANHNGASIKFTGVSNQRTGSGRSILAGALMAQEIAPNYRGVGRYKQFSFHYSGGGHAVAAWVAQDVCFFDPNYGEYWFETTAGFRRWFPQFWEMTYGPKYDGEWYANSYGKKI